MSDVDRGLDLARTGETTDAERQAFQEFYNRALGRAHSGLDFWLDNGPDVLKRYRHFANTAAPGSLVTERTMTGFWFLELYSLTGYVEGVRYIVHMWQNLGCTREQVLEGISIGFLHNGPRGMETVAEALKDYEWIEPAAPPNFPAGWGPDPEAFDSGLDFSNPALTTAELRGLEAWYERWLGEVPPQVRALAKYRPEMLKAYRNRFEHCLRTLPKQMMPYTLLHNNVIRGFGDGIREDVLMCRGFGVGKQPTMRAILSALLNGGMEGASIVARSAGDVLEAWD